MGHSSADPPAAQNGSTRAAGADSTISRLAAEELDRILASPSFRNSHQSQRLLRHLVERSLDGRYEAIRERALGVELFGRPAGFDTNDDPIVRVRANEVRKRLARYYQGLARPAPIRLDMPAGAYRIEFLPQETQPVLPPATNEAAAPSRRKLLVMLLIGAASFSALGWHFYPESPIEQFWAPVLQTSGRVIVCTGHPVVYRLSRDYLGKVDRPGDFLHRQTAVQRFQPGQKIDGKDIIPIEDQYTGLGSAHAMARVSAWLAMKDKGADIRFGDDLSFTDLKQSPAVLLGFANRWTVDFTNKFRFIPELVDGRHSVRDQQTGKIWTLPNVQDNGRTDQDYVLVSRTSYSDSGQCLITVAGLTQYGTHAGGEIITNPELMASALRQARPGWERRNIQLLFHVRVVGHTPGPASLIAVHEW